MPCTIFKREDFSFFPLVLVLAGGFINDLYFVEEISYYTYLVKASYHEWMLNFVKYFFLHLLR